MDVLQFRRAERYISRVPLHGLSFRATLWRAPLGEEHRLEQLCTITVPWGGKVLSPAEELQEIQATVGFSGSSSRCLTAASNACEQEMDNMAATSSASDRRRNAVNVINKLQTKLAKFSNVIFTRPPSEDFIDDTEEVSPVYPPQAVCPLVPVVLREHRAQHRPCNKMFFVCANGRIICPSEEPLLNCQWKGKELVMCTVASAKDGLNFLAKPSINKVHTLLVDPSHVYLFKITVLQTQEASIDQPMQSDIVRKIDSMATQVEGSVDPSRLSRNRILQQILMQGIPESPSDERPPDIKTPFHFLQPSLRDGRVRYHLFGILERCMHFSVDSLYLHCQWQHEDMCASDSGSSCGGKTSDGFTTQLTFSSGVIVEQYIPTIAHVFNIPFEYHFDGSGMAPLRLVVTAFSDEGFSTGEPQSPVGYAAVTVPHLLPGNHSIRAELWKPRMTGREFVHSAMVGGAPALVDPSSAGPNYGDGITVKCGLVTEPSGIIELRVMVLHQVVSPSVA
uniref:WGS project CAEQ00000000 data, annotated contig 20 n=1 Tax=Trypanosoma congolense (strain IL3000) TaxID=1068625 RepID=F9WAT8_TRYCI|nr:unnamed protein product [Trypanosoma congolense IL3000]